MTIKQLRESTKLSQQKFADKFNIPVANIQKWDTEMGTGYQQTFRLCSIYDTDNP